VAPFLRVSGLTKRYGKATPALDGVSFELERGQVLALLGANGAGKTTLIKCIVGLVHFVGDITLDGLVASSHGREIRARIGYLAQNPAFHDDLTVYETAQFYADLRGVPHERARELVVLAGLDAHADKAVAALSGGMRQRLALALALLGDPPLLILDEPAAGLDISARLELRHLVREQRERGTAVVLSTHWLEDVPYVADEALVLDHGRLRFLGPAAQLSGAADARSRLYLRLAGGYAKATAVVRALLPDCTVEMSADWMVAVCRPTEKAQVVEALLRTQLTILDLRVEEATLDAAVMPGLGEGAPA
jgi:ABC-type multidrug transport system ATPase subunit